MFSKRYKITLLFNANKVYDRQVIQGIGDYLQASQCDWDVFLEEDFVSRLDSLSRWHGDGIIADFDDPEVAKVLQDKNVPVVAVGSSFQNPAQYPDLPYVATDNEALVQAAFEHLRLKGLEHFAFYGMPENPNNRWAIEREQLFQKVVNANGYECSIYRGLETTPDSWQYAINRLADWVQSLPHPVGVLAVSDARARHILQVCDHLGLIVPDRLSVIGIDDEDLTRHLSRVSLSSVAQGCRSMGFEAARLLHKQLQGQTVRSVRKLIGPDRVIERQSTDFKALSDPYVIQAMHFIRHNACKGIKVDQVLDFVKVSRSNLENRFKDDIGHSVHQEIHQAKLNQAMNLLRNTDLSTNDIAELCGYPSLQYMYAVFKKDMGMTPKAYRLSFNNDPESA
ncbi:helix-turn-helix domain-containing protein [Alginatibacterium sediminis]|uniref:Helix-turn-helix domain-containing protein n=1 Tax=Alginatibacterium sediminis TaxID=2164068 RepID=A0A420E6S1_9ALTE|nr:DNA-binding transcriptional regulator [Alginatibacterium sediminis]RKF14330.1 helix-turn-helix domain-containing protein [Alginatibacterium sediminis]